MARSARISESSENWDEEAELYGASPPPLSGEHEHGFPGSAQADLSPSPPTSISSDKENQSSRPHDKGKGRALMDPPSIPLSISASGKMGASKRKRAPKSEELSVDRSVRRRTIEGNEYDPDQSTEERREIRHQMRDLSKNLVDNRAELLRPEDMNLKEMLLQANEISGKVKQTADAVIDSRFLVGAGDLITKKILSMGSGSSAQGVDLGDFISKCKAYMRRAEVSDESAQLSSTQRRRSWREDEDDESDDMLNWEHLGRSACLPNISRPSLPSFLLGPLSLQKRARKPTVRRAAFKPNNMESTRPEVLKRGDIEKSENANLTTLCTKILGRFKKVTTDQTNAAEEEYDENMSPTQVSELYDRYGVSEGGGISLFKFVINPWSFGQTVENIFYVTFLIRDGRIGMTYGRNQEPFLELAPDPSSSQHKRNNAKHQAIIAIDMAQWTAMKKLWNITEPMIQHREEEEHASVGARGWYA